MFLSSARNERTLLENVFDSLFCLAKAQLYSGQRNQALPAGRSLARIVTERKKIFALPGCPDNPDIRIIGGRIIGDLLYNYWRGYAVETPWKPCGNDQDQDTAWSDGYYHNAKNSSSSETLYEKRHISFDSSVGDLSRENEHAR